MSQSPNIPIEKLRKLNDKYPEIFQLGKGGFYATAGRHWFMVDFGYADDMFLFEQVCTTALMDNYNAGLHCILAPGYVVAEMPDVSSIQGYGYTIIEALVDLLCELP